MNFTKDIILAKIQEGEKQLKAEQDKAQKEVNARAQQLQTLEKELHTFQAEANKVLLKKQGGLDVWRELLKQVEEDETVVLETNETETNGNAS